MKWRTFIIDDESHAVDVLAAFVGRTDSLVLAGTSTDAVEAVNRLNESMPDILFLDVDMPEISGLEVAALFKERTRVVFTTAYREYGAEAYEVGASGYLLKPISYAKFLACIARLNMQPAVAPGCDDFYLRADHKGKLLRLQMSNILYVKSAGNYVDIFLAGEKITAYLTLTELQEKLPVTAFCRIHRSVLINMQHVSAVEPGFVRMTDHVRLDIGKMYRDELAGRISEKSIISYRTPG